MNDLRQDLFQAKKIRSPTKASKEPSYIVHTINKLSQIKNISKEDVIAYTTNNFKDLFNFKYQSCLTCDMT